MEVAKAASKYNCNTCQARHCDDSNPSNQSVEISHPRFGVIIRTNACLLPKLTPHAHEFMRLFNHYKNGILPFSGGLLDQPAAWYEAMCLIDNELASKPNGH